MRVKLTVNGVTTAIIAVEAAQPTAWETIAGWLDERPVLISEKRWVQMAAPATFWRTVRGCLYEALYQRKAFRSRADEERARTALQHVARAVALREMHPACRQAVAIGHHHDIIPAWLDSAGRWSPYPNGQPMRLLTPQPFLLQLVGQTSTRWLPQDPSLWTSVDPDVFADEVEHRRFVDEHVGSRVG